MWAKVTACSIKTLACATGVSVAWLAVTAASPLVPQQTASFRAGVETVAVHATVKTRNGRLVSDLTRDDFEVLDNGVRRDVVVFSNDQLPISVAILLDRSGSLVRRSDEVAAAGEAFTRHLLPGDRASIHTLTTDCQPLTADGAALTAAFRGPLAQDVYSPIWAGLDRTLSLLSTTAVRRAVVLLSDGEDTGPGPLVRLPHLFGRPNGACHVAVPRAPMATTVSGVARHAAAAGIQVYTLSIDEGYRVFGSALERIAERSGGQRYILLPNGDLTAAFTRIADELHHQYVIGFVPAALDGKSHEIAVRVKRPGLVVQARRSYLAAPTHVPEATIAAPTLAAPTVESVSDTLAAPRQTASCRLETLPERIKQGVPGARPVVLAEFPVRAVDEQMRGPVVQVSVTLEARPAPSGPAIWLEGRTPDPVVLPALGVLSLNGRITAMFDLAMFRTLAQSRVDVAVYSALTERRCRLSGDDTR